MSIVQEPSISQQRLKCGLELLTQPLAGYHTASVMLRVAGGMSSEPDDQLGLAYIVEQTIDKGTESFDARGLADAFDAIGVTHSVYTGRQSWAFVVSSLPEFVPRAVELLGELVCRPRFPQETVATAVSLSRQQLASLEDSPRGLLRREMALRAYGPVLGRHQLGRPETLAAITAEGTREYWSRRLQQGRIAVSVTGNCDLQQTKAALETAFAGLPQSPAPEAEGSVVSFTAGSSHVDKPLDQTQMGLSFAGVPYADADFAIEKVLLALLSGGMSSRLFAEVREKRGLVYWVGAWHEQPRRGGMVHIGAATTPQRCLQTYETLLGEVSRLGEDLTEDELVRAKMGLLSESVTAGASVQRHASEILVDHFHLGRAVPLEQKLAAVRAVTIDDIRGYLERHPRDSLSIVTVGREPLSGSTPSGGM